MRLIDESPTRRRNTLMTLPGRVRGSSPTVRFDNEHDTDIESGLRSNTSIYLAKNSRYSIQAALKSVALAGVTLAALTWVFHVFTSYEIMTPLTQLDEQGGRLLAATLEEIEQLTTKP
jgi:hypothetical protein